MASLLLTQLTTKAALDDAIRITKDQVVVLRFGRATDIVCMQQDDIVRLSIVRLFAIQDNPRLTQLFV